MILEVVKYPNEILDQKAKEVEFPLSQEIIQLIEDMQETVKDQGVGLSAPQVGHSLQICIIHLEDEVKKKWLNYTLINPKIIFESQIESLMIEGCLSFPGDYYEIWRPSNIIVEYFDIKGRKQKLKAKEWLARVILHEVAHLNGELFINAGGKKIEIEDLKDKDFVD
jgi:peptide deformylase